MVSIYSLGKNALVSIVCILLSGLVLLPVEAQENILDFQSVYAGARESVVTILTYEIGGITPAGMGSGFYVAPYVVVTNAHVIQGAGFLEVKKNLRDAPIQVVQVIHVDSVADIALLQTKDPSTFLPLATERSGSGEPVVVISSPLGLEKTASQGIVSGYRKRDDQVYMQITAPISPGSSGGPVLNRQGLVLGLTAFMLDGKHTQNLNFAIPSSVIQEVLDSQARPVSRDLHIEERNGEIVITD